MSDLVITGIIDGGLTGGLPKAIQLTAINDIADLSVYGVGSPNNGAAGGAVEFDLPSGMLSAGTSIYITSNTESFIEFFGFAPDFTDNVANNNGDDAIELFENGAVVDVFGAVGTDGTGEVWEYADGWASRAPINGASSTFDPASWTFSGPDALDNVATNASAPNPFPTFDTPIDPPADPVIAINEYRIASSGASNGATDFVELFTTPGASLAGKTLIALSGEFNPGLVDVVIDLSNAFADENGFVLIANSANPGLGAGDVAFDGPDFFNAPQSFLVVEGFTGAAGDDLDIDDDGVIENPPWDAILASVSGVDGDTNPDVNYSDTVVAASGNFTAAGAARDVDGTGEFVGQSFFDTAADTPGSTNTPEIPAARVTIMDIQGAGHVSALISDTPQDPTTGEGSARVITTGIVTAIDSNGFYLQDAAGDGNIATSDAIFVFTGSTTAVAIGDYLDVKGDVGEFYPGGAGSGNLSTTQISAVGIAVLSSDNALPTSVILGANGRPLVSENIEDDNFTSFDPETDGIDYWESLEGMLVTAPQPVAVSGTSRFGELFVVVDGGADATGLSERGTLNISPDDFNPEKVQIDWDFGLDAVDVNVGATFEDITGVVSYDFGYFQINPTQQIVVIEPSPLEPDVTDLVGAQNQLTIASYNVLNLDPVVEEQSLTSGGQSRNVDDDLGNGRFDAIAQQIITNLNAPDIIGLQEIQDNTGGEIGDGVVSASLTFETLIDAIDLADDGVMNDSSGYAYIDNTFITDLASGGQPGGNIRTGFLYREDRVSLVDGSVQTIGSQDAGAAFEGGRLPLVATFAFNGEEVTVVNNHFSSKGGSAPLMGTQQDFAARQEDVTVNGSLDERQAQADAVAGFVADTLASDAGANVVVVGDFNEFEFVSPLTTLEASGLSNLTNTLPEDERYTFNFQGNSQALDHILVSGALAQDAQFDIVHVNSEVFDSDNKASDHDPLVAQLTIGEVTTNTVQVAVEFERTSFFQTKATQIIDGDSVDAGTLAYLARTVTFRDIDVKLIANALGEQRLSLFDGEVGVWSENDNIFNGEANLVNDREQLTFKLDTNDLGDATEATFDFGNIRGGGVVRVKFFDENQVLEVQRHELEGSTLTVDLDGLGFDKVRIFAAGDTAFSLDGFAFEREVADDFTFV